MKRGTKIKLEKLQVNPAAILPSANMKDYKPGQPHFGVSLPVGYSMEGTLQRDVKVGQTLFMHRTKRNDIEAFGVTETSEIMAIQGDILLTQNSVYRLTEIPESIKWAEGKEPELDEEP